MSKGQWHVNNDGEVGRCHAENGKCPYGGAEEGNHASTKKEAEKIAEKKLSEKYCHGCSFKKVSKNVAKDPFAIFPESLKDYYLGDNNRSDTFFTASGNIPAEDLHKLTMFHLNHYLGNILERENLIDEEEYLNHYVYDAAKDLDELSKSDFGKYYRGYKYERFSTVAGRLGAKTPDDVESLIKRKNFDDLDTLDDYETKVSKILEKDDLNNKDDNQ